MPPASSQKGTGKKGGAAAVRQPPRSRNTTPNSLPTPTASLPPIETQDTETLDLRFDVFRNLTYEDLVDSGASTAIIPDSKALDGIVARLQRLGESIEKRGTYCDRGMRLLAANRRTRMDEIAEEGRREDERRQKEAEDEAQARKANKKKRKATENLASSASNAGSKLVTLRAPSSALQLLADTGFARSKIITLKVSSQALKDIYHKMEPTKIVTLKVSKTKLAELLEKNKQSNATSTQEGRSTATAIQETQATAPATQYGQATTTGSNDKHNAATGTEDDQTSATATQDSQHGTRPSIRLRVRSKIDYAEDDEDMQQEEDIPKGKSLDLLMGFLEQKSNRGGARPGAGRKPKSQSCEPDPGAQTSSFLVPPSPGGRTTRNSSKSQSLEPEFDAQTSSAPTPHPSPTHTARDLKSQSQEPNSSGEASNASGALRSRPKRTRSSQSVELLRDALRSKKSKSKSNRGGRRPGAGRKRKRKNQKPGASAPSSRATSASTKAEHQEEPLADETSGDGDWSDVTHSDYETADEALADDAPGEEVHTPRRVTRLLTGASLAARSSPLRESGSGKAKKRDRDNDSASSSLSPVAARSPSNMDVDDKAKAEEKSDDDDDSSSDDGRPPPQPRPQANTFGEDPSTFPDPTVYEILPVKPGMTEDEIKEIYSVATYPKSDLADLIAGDPPDKDFSSAKPTNQINFTTFSTYLDPFFRQYTEEDLAFLRERGDRVAPFVIPRRGKKHYTEIWAEEDGAMAIDSPSKDKNPPNQPRGSIDNIDDEVAETDKVSVGPLLSRLLSAMRPERRAPPAEAANGVNGDGDTIMNGVASFDFSFGEPAQQPQPGQTSPGGTVTNGNGVQPPQAEPTLPPATQMPEANSEAWKKATHPKLDYQQVDERIKQELRHIGFFPMLPSDGSSSNNVSGTNGASSSAANGASSSSAAAAANSSHPNAGGADPSTTADYDGAYDDEVAARLRLLQEILRKQTLINGARKSRLTDAVKERMAHQEYQTILEDLDSQVQAAYLKRTRTMGKKPKKARPGAAANPAASAAGGLARPGIGDLTKTLIERRRRWIESIGPVFDGENLGKVPRVEDPGSSIFQGDVMAELLKREKDNWDEDEADAE